MSSTEPILGGSLPSSVKTLKGLPVHLRVSADGNRLAIGTHNGVVVRVLPSIVELKYKPIQVYTGSKNPIRACAISPRGNIVAGGDNDGNIYVWEHEKHGTKLNTYNLNMKHVHITDISFSADGKRIAVVGTDRYAKKASAVILADSGATVGQLLHHERGMYACDYRPTRPTSVVTVGWDGTININPGPPFKNGYTLDQKHTGTGMCVRWDGEGGKFATLNDSGDVFIFDHSGDLIRDFKVKMAENETSYALTFNPSGTRLAVACSSHVYVMDLTGKVDCTIDPPAKVVLCGIIWTKTFYILVSTTEGHIIGYPIEQTPEFQKFQEAAAMKAIDVGSDHEASEDIAADDAEEVDYKESTLAKSVSVVDMSAKLSPVPGFSWTGPIGQPTCSCVVGSTAFFGTTTGTILMMDYSAGTIQSHSARVPGFKEMPIRCLVAKDGVGIAGTSDGEIHLFSFSWDGGAYKYNKTAQEESKGKGVELVFIDQVSLMQAIAGAVLIEDGTKAIIFGSNGYCVCVPLTDTMKDGAFDIYWEVELEGKVNEGCVTVSEDGKLVAVGLELKLNPQDKSIIYTQDKIATWTPTPGTGDPDNDGTWSYPPDGMETRHVVEIYEIDNGNTYTGFRFVQTLMHHKMAITSVSLSPSGSKLATASKGKDLYIVIVETGIAHSKEEWVRHTTPIMCMDWASNDVTFATGSIDQNIYMWNYDNVTWRSAIVPAHKGGVRAVKFLHNNELISTGADASVSIWEFRQAGVEDLANQL